MVCVFVNIGDEYVSKILHKIYSYRRDSLRDNFNRLSAIEKKGLRTFFRSPNDEYLINMIRKKYIVEQQT